MSKFTEISKHGDRLSYPVGDDIRAATRHAIECARYIEKVAYEKKVDGVWVYCRGSSGAILAALTASFMYGLPSRVAHIKKDGESSHSDYISAPPYNWMCVIIDDFIYSGDTILSIVRKVRAEWPSVSFDMLIVQSSFAAKTPSQASRILNSRHPGIDRLIEEVVVVTPEPLNP